MLGRVKKGATAARCLSVSIPFAPLATHAGASSTASGRGSQAAAHAFGFASTSACWGSLCGWGADLIFRQLGAAAAFSASQIVSGETEERHGHRPLVPLTPPSLPTPR
ncbi:hypothetical protein MTO96_012825 [Rhipicephalus appendiculatus]